MKCLAWVDKYFTALCFHYWTITYNVVWDRSGHVSGDVFCPSFASSSLRKSSFLWWVVLSKNDNLHFAFISDNHLYFRRFKVMTINKTIPWVFNADNMIWNVVSWTLKCSFFVKNPFETISVIIHATSFVGMRWIIFVVDLVGVLF